MKKNLIAVLMASVIISTCFQSNINARTNIDSNNLNSTEVESFNSTSYENSISNEKDFVEKYSKNKELDDYKKAVELIQGDKGFNMVFAGDSITHGLVHTNNYRSYSEHFNERLRGENINRNIVSEKFVINTGNSACTTREVLNGFDTWIGLYNPEIVSLMIGMNDCATDTNITIEQYESNLREIVRKIRDIGAVPILQTPNYVLPAPSWTSSGQRRDRLNEYLDVARKVATEEKIIVIDHYKYWEEREKSSGDVSNRWFNDWIHPNQVGHLEMARLMFEELGLNTEDSYTANLSYPIKVEGDNGRYIEKSAYYPDYKGLDNKEPKVSYKVNRQFIGSDYIDKTDDINSIKDLSTGTIVARFNVENPRAAQTIFSMTDSKDADSGVTLAINENGKIHFSVRNNGSIKVNINTNSQGYNDGNWHTLAVNVLEDKIVIYVDGIKIHTENISGFFSDVETPDSVNIGRNKNNQELGKWNYYGALSYIDIYDKPLEVYEIIEILTENQVQNTDSIAGIFSGGEGKRTVFVGDESTAGKVTTYGYRNYVEYLEERIRADYGYGFEGRTKYFINSGVNGSTTTDILNNFDRWVKLHGPKAVFLMVGGNENISPEDFEVNLNLLADKIEEIGALPVMQTPTIKENNIEEYVNIVRKVGAERGFAVIDHYDYWNKLSENQDYLVQSWMSEDYVPNHRGNLEIARKILKDIGLYSGSSLIGRFNISNPGDNLDELKVELNNLVNETKEHLNTINEGYMPGDYLPGGKDKVLRELKTAESELALNSSIANITKIITNINESLNELNGSVITTELGDVNRDGKIDTKDISLVSSNIGKNIESSDWNIAKQYDLNEDGKVDKDDVFIIRDIIFNR
ncbi:GDSL-type esterase/lipase family protein [Clostridium sp.]|uniref:GDSL-type esterase/lipase family protein n=1 Tax=Clostridium sp. TaxID=1506 RepID=UPI003F4142A0